MTALRNAIDGPGRVDAVFAERVHYPAASDDILAGWTWAVQHTGLLGVRAEQLHLRGASAGAALTAGLATGRVTGRADRLHRSSWPIPLVPAELPEWGPTELAAIRDTADVIPFSPDWIPDCTLDYVGDPAARADPYAFAANAHASGLPPTLVVNCQFDTLCSSGEA